MTDKGRSRRIIAHVADAGPDARRFECSRCGWDSDWIFDHMTDREIRRGVPCPKCNGEPITPPITQHQSGRG